VLCRDGINGAGAYASTAIDAGIVDFVLVAAFGNCVYRAISYTRTARNTITADFMSHGVTSKKYFYSSDILPCNMKNAIGKFTISTPYIS